MSHQCIECGRTFSDGSKEMLSGCPECGGNKFQFRPSGSTESPADSLSSTGDPSPDAPVSSDASNPSGASSPSDASNPSEASDAPDASNLSKTPDGSGTSGSAGSTRDTPTTVHDSDDATDPTSDRAAGDAAEDTAQASARSDVVTPDELDRASRDSGASDSEDPTAPRPDVDELRDELNEQFESIRIVSPGTYELNLMELYDRQEYIISLQEDGRYVIEMPDAWGVDEE